LWCKTMKPMLIDPSRNNPHCLLLIDKHMPRGVSKFL
jgi:hypothetical protein